MADEPEDEQRDWIVIEGPGSEDADDLDSIPPERDLGKEHFGAGYGASTGGVEGEPGPPGPAPGEIPEHTGPVPIVGTDELYSAEEEEDEG